MLSSLVSRITGKSGRKKDETPTPDLSRVLGPSARPGATEAPAAVGTVRDIETIDVDLWLRADLERLDKAWQALQASPNDSVAREQFLRAVHDLYGASGAYGGGALTRLSGSLHKLVTRGGDIASDAALINLHVQACRAAGLGQGKSGDDVADAVCDALEAQVEQSLAQA